ncbi:MAG: hypothetical protein AAB074_11735 [Planctomycetota bacterium]
MRKLKARSSALLLALCAAKAQAQLADPVVYEKMFAEYELSGLKGGEWVEYETTGETVERGSPGTPDKAAWRLACVGVEPDAILLETNRETEHWWPGTVIVYSVDRKSGLVTKAWWGKPGEPGKEVEVPKSDDKKPANPVKKTGFEGSGTIKISKEKLSVPAGDFECEKSESDITTKLPQREYRQKTATWTSEKVPFPLKRPAAGAPDPYDGKVKTEGKAEGKGGEVKSTFEESDSEWVLTSTTVLKRSGNDAKMSLKK